MSGHKPQGKVKLEWSSNFAYAIGLIVSDGCLSRNGRMITFVSKDLEQINNFKKCLNINPPTTMVFGFNKSKAYRIQFGDVLFCKFLNNIGIYPAKSLTIGSLKIPKKYFFDFVRGAFDGDGCTYSYWDRRWRSSFMFYLGFASGSLKYISWLRKLLSQFCNVKGHISFTNRKNNHTLYQLRYAKKEAVIVLESLYYPTCEIFLTRKYLKIIKALHIIGKHV